MIDVRPVAYVVGWLMLMLGGLMALPMVVDIAAGHSDAVAFAVSAVMAPRSSSPAPPTARRRSACGRAS